MWEFQKLSCKRVSTFAGQFLKFEYRYTFEIVLLKFDLKKLRFLIKFESILHLLSRLLRIEFRM